MIFSIPSLWVSARWLGRYGSFTSADELGNLLHRLSWLQAFGIWPSGDFRVAPHNLDVTRALVALAAAAAVFACVVAVRRRAVELPTAIASAVFACVVYLGLGSPWIGGKALAPASPIVLAAAFAGAAAVYERGRRVEAIAGGVVLLGALLWSNALQYRDVDLAPSSRLAELATIGHRFSGQGPTLLTEYEPYGARHFLRGMDAEAASELRRRHLSARGRNAGDRRLAGPGRADARVGAAVPDAGPATLGNDEPPSVRVRAGLERRFYQVWQRPAYSGSIIDHVSLGSRVQPATVPSCSRVLEVAQRAAVHHGQLAAVERPPAIVIEPNGSVGLPSSYGAYGESPEVSI